MSMFENTYKGMVKLAQKEGCLCKIDVSDNDQNLVIVNLISRKPISDRVDSCSLSTVRHLARQEDCRLLDTCSINGRCQGNLYDRLD